MKRTMRIEVLSVPDCPHHVAALARVRQALASLALAAQVEERWVRSGEEARALGFTGSPTVRIDGRDVEPASTPPSLACRLYAGGDGLPALATLRASLAEAAAACGNPS